MAEVDLAKAINLTPSLLEQLGKALIELEAHKDGSEDKVSFAEISEHFRDLEAKIMKKYSELEAKGKAFKQEESEGLSLLAAKEEAVAAKEQDMYDRIQVLKDAAVVAIAEARANHPPASLDSYDVVDSTENKVHCSFGETNAPLSDPKEGSSANSGGTVEVMLQQELTRFCEQMDTIGLLSFIIENRKIITSINEKLSLALESSTEPGRFVLCSLGGFYPPGDATQEGDNKDTATLQGMHQSCLNLMEAMSTLLARANSGADHLLNSEIKHLAKAIADEWRPKLAHDSMIDTADGKSLEAQAFLQLLATFKIASEFDEEELCKLALAVAEQRQAPELCRCLGLTHKMPGVIEELISKGKLIGAVHFVHAFELMDRYPTVPLLKTYLRDLRRNSQGKRGSSANSDAAQNDGNMKELAALRVVIQCVQKYNLEADYPLDPLHRRVGQLEKVKVDRKRYRESSTKPHHSKKPRANGGRSSYSHRNHAIAAAVTGRPAPPPAYVDRSAYVGSSERYLHAGLSDPYLYQAAPQSQTTYGQQGYDQMSYYYTPDDVAAVAAAAPPAYSGYTTSGLPSSYQPYV